MSSNPLDRRAFVSGLSLAALYGPGTAQACTPLDKPIGYKYVIAEPCIGTKSGDCTEVCPVDCIYGATEDWDQLFINPVECIACGLCEPACPVEAIFTIEAIPTEWNSYIEKARSHFGLC